jgi:hypothetical protein
MDPGWRNTARAVKAAVTAEIEARSEETPENFFSVNDPAPEAKVVTVMNQR